MVLALKTLQSNMRGSRWISMWDDGSVRDAMRQCWHQSEHISNRGAVKCSESFVSGWQALEGLYLGSETPV